MSRERMTERAGGLDAAVAALEKAVLAVDDAGLESAADVAAKAEKETVSESVPAGPVELKDVGDQNAKANANWPLTAAEKQRVAAKLVGLAKELLKA